jgi:ubiquinone/menaquinone biosynthesis C-methylase UbiE
MRRPPLANATFDGVWLCASLLHLPRAQAPAALQEARRVLLPGGPLFISLQVGKGEGWKTDDGARLFTYYQPAELQELVEKANFKVETSWTTTTEYTTWTNLVALAL